MKRIVALAVCIILALSSAAVAEISKDERNLAREAKRLNDTAAKPDGEKAVVKRLAAEFKTPETQVQSLRDKKLGYGEVAIVLSLAQTLPGGATDANVQRVLTLRQGPPVMGWGQVAQQLGTKLGKTVSRVRKAANNTNRDIKNDHARAGKSPIMAPAEQKQQEQKSPEPPRSSPGDGKLLKHGSSAQ